MSLLYSQIPGRTTAVGITTPGLYPESFDVPMIARGGAVVLGDVLMLDVLASDVASTTITPFSTDSIFSSCVTPSAAAVAGTAPGIFVVALEAAADDGLFMARVSGVVSASSIGTEVQIGVRYPILATRKIDLDGTSTNPVIAIGAENNAAPEFATGALGIVWFSGLHRIFGVMP